MDLKHKFPYEWYLKDGYPAKGIDYHGSKVFSCFACGGGSSMGYKLAGYDVIGMNEIDPKMAEAYVTNHNPKFCFIEPIQEFVKREKFPDELYELDILDGSPPCSSFSMAGNREKDWGKEKKFREGQADQILDTLFFDFIELAGTLQPKVVIAENVKGLLMGTAKEYVGRIGQAFDKAGYYVEKWLLDASKMGVPQCRERVFFVAIRKDLGDLLPGSIDMFNPMPNLDMQFKGKEIPFKEIYDGLGKPITEHQMQAWKHRKHGDSSISVSKERAGMKPSDFNNAYIYDEKPMPTITGKGALAQTLFSHPLHPSDMELCKGGSYPMDYKYSNMGYIIGMSVPPVMTGQISNRIYKQWLNEM